MARDVTRLVELCKKYEDTYDKYKGNVADVGSYRTYSAITARMRWLQSTKSRCKKEQRRPMEREILLLKYKSALYSPNVKKSKLPPAIVLTIQTINYSQISLYKNKEEAETAKKTNFIYLSALIHMCELSVK